MSSDLAIRAEGLGKAYTIRHQISDHVTLAQVALDRAKHPLRRSQRERFWALEDVSFDVAKGEVLGVVGRNGAGKSTLLKLLTRITGPSSGHIDLWGRVGSLLEVGTGFHPELTGRENVYLNGSILGMSRKEIDRQFDAIVDFAGVARFLDTPVKRYSSGMYVRLAFAVAAHLQTEILLVDEVLAVGDQDFQKKCLQKMHEVSTGGRTVLFVSHQLSSVTALCDRALLLEGGRIVAEGSASSVVERYATAETPGTAAVRRHGLPGDIRIAKAWPEHSHFDPHHPKVIHFQLERQTDELDRCFVAVVIKNAGGTPVAHCDSSTVGAWFRPGDEGVDASFELRSPWLIPGDYTADLFVCNAGVYDALENACSFTVLPSLPYEAPPAEDVIARDLVLPDFGFTSET